MGLKELVFGRKRHEDYGDIRSEVLGMTPAPEPTPVQEPRPFSDPFAQRFAPRPEPSMFEEPITRERGLDYDLSQRLTVIESQLAAIRSQTETINERLKNLEMKLGRRY